MKFSGNIFVQKIQAAVFPLLLQSFSLAKKSTSQNDDRFEESGRVHCVVLTRLFFETPTPELVQKWCERPVFTKLKIELDYENNNNKNRQRLSQSHPKLLQCTADIFTPN